ncbi:MAG: ATP-sensitive inward rectifier potassium channel 10 [Verrucomicrobia bacterium]|nr:MAG: ATP-sensitive inward rectifier potassium channel 10 [Verrucomicrobiota bacterium]
MKHRPRSPISTRAGRTEFLKINAAVSGWRDSYHWVLSLSWPRFALFLAGSYIVINLLFATLYALGGNCIADMTPGSFPQAFFFSVETLATVGYGHNYPATVYGHIVVTIEIFLGMIWIAVITGLIFVRFARPTARIVFSNCLVIAPFDGRLSLMFRVANLRHTSMAEAEFRMIYSRDERVLEGEDIRRFYELEVYPKRMISFPAALIIRHTIDELSPLYGITPERLEKEDAFFVASTLSLELVMAASVQSQQDYAVEDVRFGERFVDVYTQLESGRLTVDYGRLHETEPVPIVIAQSTSGGGS